MSAADALQPRQFGPDGKYTTRVVDMHGRDAGQPKYARSVEAVHSGSGRRVGYLSADKWPDGRTQIGSLYVSAPHRRKGVATEMLNHARDVWPGMEHSHALHPDGAAFAKARP